MQKQLFLANTLISQAQKAGTTTPVNQTSGTTAGLKDYIPLISGITVAILTTLFSVIIALLWKWKDEAIKRMEAEKKAEINNITIEKNNELIAKTNEIASLTLQVDDWRRKYELANSLTPKYALEMIQNTKRLSEETYELLNKQAQALSQNNESLTQENRDLRLRLQQKGERIGQDLQKISLIEEYLINRFQNSQEASIWLRNNQIRLSQESGEVAIERINSNANLGKFELEQKKSQFFEDIQDYLLLISECLNLGRPNLLDKADIPPIIPPDFYIETFKIIKDEKATSEITNKEAIEEMEVYFDYLIAFLRTISYD